MPARDLPGTDPFLTEVTETGFTAMLTDRWCLEHGEHTFEAHLRSHLQGVPLTVLMVDLDGSTAVRRLGVEPKRALLTQVRHLVRSVTSPVLTIEGGQRDKTYAIVREGDRDRARDLAERVRKRIRSSTFRLVGQLTPVRSTASVGAAVMSGPFGAGTALQRARDATVLAKRTGDSSQILTTGGPAHSSVLLHGLDLLAEKYGPVWYWAIQRAADPTRTLERLRELDDAPEVPAPARSVMRLLVSTAVVEATLRSWGETSTLTASSRMRPPPGADRSGTLVAPALPGRWLTARPAASHAAPAVPDGDAMRRIRRALDESVHHASEAAAAELPGDLGPWAEQVLQRSARHGHGNRRELLTEAISLGMHHRDIWMGQDGIK